ncbi:MAG: 1-deoxy-D-xylulose-5-phosphate reductoisomerase, partial [Candidatus Dormibacteraeota bacterium]|nr:1-deoxy-D-xylulose-5-phosphate reductoisomerase [Candidatus Dormibacteraeota bacterium]
MSALRVAILGASGSIGQQALSVIDHYPERFQVFGLVSGRRRLDRPARFSVRAGDPGSGDRIEEMVTHPECDLVLVAIPGVVALGPTLAALRAHKKVALATKEILVMAGELVMGMARGHDAIRPVDSEHSALWQCLWGEAPASVSRLLLTASGGPFWARPEQDLSSVTVEQALNHPRWSMGPKVTVDSATLMNKGLELIEAHHLFGFPYDRIAVVVHPQSIVHGLIQLNDGASLAHMGYPDMRVPISYALHFPERADVALEPLDLTSVGGLTFEAPDLETFPCLALARDAGEAGGTAPCVLNAANE